MKKIAIIKTKWNTEFVDNCSNACEAQLQKLWQTNESINTFIVPWAVEIPLLAKKLLQDNGFDAVIAIAIVYKWGIYRHEFVAQWVVSEVIKLSSDIGKPIFSSILTPDTDHFENPEKQAFYLEHLKQKWEEVADACLETLALHDSIS